MATTSRAEFTLTEALEFADAFRKPQTGQEARDLAVRVYLRIRSIEAAGDEEAPSYLYAAWRGYEAAIEAHEGRVSATFPVSISLRYGVTWDMDARHEATA